MRYLFLALTVIVNLIFTGVVFPRLSILGISPDIIICTMASITALEKSRMGAAIGFICGLLLDIMFTSVIGFYTLPYFVVGMGLYFVSDRIRYIDPVLVPDIFALGAFLIKELLAALLAYMLGRDVSLGYRFMRFVLPEMLATGLLMLLIHLIIKRLYRSNSIRPKGMEDLKKLL
jgi:rod shape-determining protein MreD